MASEAALARSAGCQSRCSLFALASSSAQTPLERRLVSLERAPIIIARSHLPSTVPPDGGGAEVQSNRWLQPPTQLSQALRPTARPSLEMCSQKCRAYVYLYTKYCPRQICHFLRGRDRERKTWFSRGWRRIFVKK